MSTTTHGVPLDGYATATHQQWGDALPGDTLLAGEWQMQMHHDERTAVPLTAPAFGPLTVLELYVPAADQRPGWLAHDVLTAGGDRITLQLPSTFPTVRLSVAGG